MNINFLRGFDNKHLDLGRVLWAIGVLAYVGLAGYSTWKTGQLVDLINFAIGFGIIHGVGAGGAGVKDFFVAKAFALKQAALEPGRVPG